MTEVTRDLPWLVRVGDMLAFPIMAVLRKSMAAGAYTTIYVATSPALRGMGGQYFVHCKPAPTSTGARIKDDAARLWELSEKLVGGDSVCAQAER